MFYIWYISSQARDICLNLLHMILGQKTRPSEALLISIISTYVLKRPRVMQN